ncbi:hypothetical protein HPP92_000376 [Vanilla planifolia]|uniref:Uncharacterized protein n=1 Tax=Vanilla planifolia TaxID=51239 RepID=A0A835VG16_VANPL|nr:hypothetical protein HPP92_000376 [Vanilla planifolia]
MRFLVVYPKGESERRKLSCPAFGTGLSPSAGNDGVFIPVCLPAFINMNPNLAPECRNLMIESTHLFIDPTKGVHKKLTCFEPSRVRARNQNPLQQNGGFTLPIASNPLEPPPFGLPREAGVPTPPVMARPRLGAGASVGDLRVDNGFLIPSDHRRRAPDPQPP